MYDAERDIGLEPFDSEFDSRFFYRGFQHASALSFLDRASQAGESVVALTGAAGTGKRSTLKHFLREGGNRFRSAHLDEIPEDGHEFLQAVLEVFGFGPVEAERNELRNLLSVFFVQVQQEGQQLLLHIHNPPGFSEDVAEEILWLTGDQAKNGSIRLILTGAEELDRVLDSPRMAVLADRLRLRHRLHPLSAREVHDYLYFRLSAAGCGRPADVFSSLVATAIYAASTGVPGIVNQLAAGLLEASKGPAGKAMDVDLVKSLAAKMGLAGVDAVGVECRLVISLEGEPFLEVPVGRDKLLIGRHSFNDISLRDNSVSRHHAIVVPDGGAWVIVDLNSTNGTMVNDKPVRQQALSDGDEIRIGRFDLVFEGGPAVGKGQPPEDTDMRRTVVLNEQTKAVS
jgi:type II secretory pathway predicted ATPase ExeA